MVIATRDEDVEWLRFIQNAQGAILSPFDSFLVLRGTKTLALRMAQHNVAGLALAELLAGHPKVQQRVLSGPAHASPARAGQRARCGASAACSPSNWDRSRRPVGMLNNIRLMALAESLGGVETLVSHPATMTHASVPAEQRAALGITDGLVRISAGVEDLDDLKEDLLQALEAV